MIKTKIKQTVKGAITNNWRKLQGRTRQSRLWLAGAVIAGVVALCLVGGGVYAAFFGGAGTSDSLGSSPIQLQKGLVGYWNFNGNAHDSSSYGDNGTIGTGVTPTTDREGKANSAYGFTASTASSIIASNMKTFPTTAISTSFWVKTIDNGGRYFVSYSPTGGNDWLLGYPAGLVIYRGGSTLSTGVAVNDGNWHDITITWRSSDGQTQVYKDGVLAYTGTLAQGTSIPGGSNGCLVFGQDQDAVCGGFDAGQAYIGTLDDVRIYNRVISSSEAAALYSEYDSGLHAASGENGLVGWWKLDGNAKDSSSYGNNGTVNGATPTTDREGKANSAYSFNGTSDYILVPDSSSLNSAPAVTVSVWFKVPAATTKYQKLIGKGPDATEEYGLYITPNTGLLHLEYDSGTAHLRLASSASVADNQWHLASTTYDGTTLCLFLDGAQIASTSVSGGLAANTENVSIGAEKSSSTSQYFLNGYLADARIYNRALSATEINNLYNSYNSQVSVSNLQSGLVGHWAFNGNAHDSSSYGNQGTVNGATLTTDREGRTNSAYSFTSGTMSRVTLGSGVVLNDNYTESVWVYPTITDSGNTYYSILGNDTASPCCNMRAPSIWIYKQTYVHTGFGDGTGWDAFLTPAGVITENAWNLITVTFDGTTTRAYVNGVIVGSTTIGSGKTPYPTPVLYAGGFNSGGTNSMAGTIDDVRIYNRALSATEVQQLYNEYQ